MSFRLISFVAAMLMPVLAFAAPEDEAFFENFEGITPNTTVGVPITLGAAPGTATLSGNAFAGVVGNGSLYHSGIRSWMVLENSTGMIEFLGNNAASVAFWAKADASADGNTVITAFDDLDNVIGSVVTLAPGAINAADPSGKNFTLVSFAGDIDHISIVNQASNAMNGIDDLGFTTVPEPSVALLLGGAWVLVGTRKRSL